MTRCNCGFCVFCIQRRLHLANQEGGTYSRPCAETWVTTLGGPCAHGYDHCCPKADPHLDHVGIFALQKQGPKGLEDNVTIGIYWTNQRNVPPDEAKLLRANLGSFVRQGVVVANLPPSIGAFDLGPARGPHRLLYLCASLSRNGQREEVGYLVDNPNPSSGIPSDGTVSHLDYVDQPRTKPERSEKQPAGFGWDPGYGDD